MSCLWLNFLCWLCRNGKPQKLSMCLYWKGLPRLVLWVVVFSQKHFIELCESYQFVSAESNVFFRKRRTLQICGHHHQIAKFGSLSKTLHQKCLVWLCWFLKALCLGRILCEYQIMYRLGNQFSCPDVCLCLLYNLWSVMNIKLNLIHRILNGDEDILLPICSLFQLVLWTSSVDMGPHYDRRS